MIIRTEEISDYKEIKNMVKLAFEGAEHTDGNEHNLINKLRQSKGFVKELTLVAEENNRIIGHIMFTEVKIGKNVGLALAPLAVLPNMQKKGIGKALMSEAHKRAKEMGYKFCIVLGSEKYYPKVGYKMASEFNIFPPFDVPKENFMVLFLSDNTLDVEGKVEYVKEMLE